MALAAATHDSAQQNAAPRGPKTGARAREVEEQVSHVGLRAQKTPPPVERPGILPEPSPQRSDRSRRHFSGDGLPQLALPSLAGVAGEAVDAAALAFLLSHSLAAQEHNNNNNNNHNTTTPQQQHINNNNNNNTNTINTTTPPTPTPPTPTGV